MSHTCVRDTARGITLITMLTASCSASAQQSYDHLVIKHAEVYSLPPELVHRVIKRESQYNPLAVNKGNYGIMQIRVETARAMGYLGNAEGLFDPDTNMTYAVRYLAGAYRAAGCDADRAMRLYSTGYYTQAKRQGFSAYTLAPAKPEKAQSSAAAEPVRASAEDGKAAVRPSSKPSSDVIGSSDCLKR